MTEESTTVVEKDVAVEGEATDANKETPVEVPAEKEPEDTVHYHLFKLISQISSCYLIVILLVVGDYSGGV